MTAPYADRLGQTVEPPAFSNGTEFHMWYANYCGRCWHDRAINRAEGEPDWGKGCKLVAHGMAHERVEAWVYTDQDWPMHVHCVKFTPDDGGGDAGPPVPQPVPPGQEVMFDPSGFDWDREREGVSS